MKLLMLTALLCSDYSYGPPEAMWIDYKDVHTGWEQTGSLQEFSDVDYYITADFTTMYIPPPPAYPIPVYNHYHYEFNDSQVISVLFGGNTLEVVVDRGIIFRNGFEK